MYLRADILIDASDEYCVVFNHLYGVGERGQGAAKQDEKVPGTISVKIPTKGLEHAKAIVKVFNGDV